MLAGDVTVENVNIKDIGHISTDVTGLGIFNWLAELVSHGQQPTTLYVAVMNDQNKIFSFSSVARLLIWPSTC